MYENSYSESVQVPSSLHVAEIVGKHGNKIKWLSSNSKTIIKTPYRGENPIFVITGRKENVLAVKSEILIAADHFTTVHKTRNDEFESKLKKLGSHCKYLEVPIKLVGLIVGRNGSIIKNIQINTNTLIVTPKCNTKPCFKLFGDQINIETAINVILNYSNSKSFINYMKRDINNLTTKFIMIENNTKRTFHKKHSKNENK